MESINFLLIFILLFLVMFLVIRVINKSNNNSLLYINNIDRFINKKFSKFIKPKEGFSEYSQNVKRATEKLQLETNRNKPVTTKKPHFKSLPIDKVSDSCKSCCSKCHCSNPENSLDELINNLDNLEEKCRYFEGKRDEYDTQETERTDKLMKEQIELEDKKIDELKEIVNYYRRKYNEKISISSKCRKQKIETLEGTAKKLYDIENKDLLKNYKNNIEVNLTDFIKKQNI